MTNEQKFKTPEERQAAFREVCKVNVFPDGRYCKKCHIGNTKKPGMSCEFAWLALEDDGNIMGHESPNKQCWECANCQKPTGGWDRSKFRCAFLAKDFDTWHYDVPNECPCKGNGWIPKKKEGDAK